MINVYLLLDYTFLNFFAQTDVMCAEKGYLCCLKLFFSY